ncbi:MAG: hypothetical protein NVSMB17_13390 [Candidatus Dormibacteria bacterium]
MAFAVAGQVSPASADTPANLEVKATLPLPRDGQPYHGKVTGTAQSITGCYRWEVSGLPPGLRVDPQVTCTQGAAQSVETAITGTPSLRHGVTAPAQLVVHAFAVDGPAARPRPGQHPSGEATVAMVPQPDPWTTPKSNPSYANSGLTLVSCPSVSACWVLGTSSNPPVGTSTSSTGVPAKFVDIAVPTSSKKLKVIAGGTYLARVTRLDPLQLDVVRTGIPGTWHSMSCATPTFCLLAGSTSTTAKPQPAPSILMMADSGASWNLVRGNLPSRYLKGEFTGLSCVGSGCSAVGYVSGDPGSDGYSAQVGVDLRDNALHAERYLGTESSILNSVSCTQSRACVAVGATGGHTGVLGAARILKSSDGGASWRIGQVTSSNPGGNSEVAPQPWMPTVDGAVTLGSLSAVGCAPQGSGDSCAALWPFWYIITNTYDGTHWVPDVVTQMPLGMGGGPQSRISCPSPGHCFMPTNAGACVSAHCTFAGIMGSIADGPTWKWGIAGIGPSDILHPGVEDISCPSLTGCVAVGRWSPRGDQRYSPVYPLLMTPQHPSDPFFVPPPEPDYLAQLSTGLGAVAVILGLPLFAEAAPFIGVIALLSGIGSASLGLRACSSGDTFQCGVSAVALLGASVYTAGLSTFLLSFLPTAPDPPPLALPDWLKAATATGGISAPDDA